MPPELARIVERLIAKEPADRYPSVEEALADLRSLRGGRRRRPPASCDAAAPPHRRWRLDAWPPRSLVGSPHRGRLLLARACGRTPPPVQVSFTRLTEQEGSETFPSLSPDGDDFVYVKADVAGEPRHLLAADRRQQPPQPDRGLARSTTPSRPSRRTASTIAFRSERDGGGIFLMGATGESVRRLTDFGYNPAWSPDGKEIAGGDRGGPDPQVRRTKSAALAGATCADGGPPPARRGGRRAAELVAARPADRLLGDAAGSARRAIWTVPAERRHAGAGDRTTST